MSAKEALAKLSTQLNKPLDEYIAIDVATEISRNSSLLGKLEPFCLPEITKLICGHRELIKRFGEKYSHVRPYYEDGSAEATMGRMADTEKDSSYYIDVIFPLADDRIIEGFIHAYNRLEKSINYHQKLIKEQEEEVARTQAKIDTNATERKEVEDALAQFSEGSTDDQYKELVRRRSSLKGNLTKYNKTLETAKSKIADHMGKCDTLREQYLRLHEAYSVAIVIKGDYALKISAARKEAFEACDERNAIKRLVDALIATETVSVDLSDGLKNYDFCVQFVSLLSKSYPENALQIISLLYENGLIDICDDPFSTFLEMNADKVSGYFMERYLPNNSLSFDIEATDFDSWCDYIVRSAFFETELGQAYTSYDLLWDNIPSPEAWRVILDAIKQHDEDLLADCLAKLLLRVNGNARKHLLLVAQEMILQEEIESCSTLVVALIDNHVSGDDCSAIVELLMQRIENENRKLKGTNERLKFNADRVSSKAYGALSKPIESLEVLAANIASSHNAVSPEIISSKLKKYLISLRDGLEVFDIYTVEDPEKWLNRTPVAFDPEKHSISIPTPPQTVYLRSLGFAYQDIMGEEKNVPAVVGRLQELDSQKKSTPPTGKPNHAPHGAGNTTRKTRQIRKHNMKGGAKG